MSPRSPRGIAALVFAAGLVIGTLADRVPERVRQRAGEYWILAGDFHVHGFPGDGSLAPWALADEAARAGLDVIAVTNHNQVFAGRLARWVARRRSGPIVLAGQEITNREYHIAAFGLERTVYAHQPASASIADVHAQGGVAVAAHPGRDYNGYDDGAVARLNGVEAAHPAMDESDEWRADLSAFHQRARGLNPRVSPIGSSDFHASPALGWCRTFVLAREWSERGVLDAIRSGSTVAMDRRGQLSGNADLVALVRSATPQGRTDPHPWLRRTSAALAWLGALGIVMLSGRRREAHS